MKFVKSIANLTLILYNIGLAITIYIIYFITVNMALLIQVNFWNVLLVIGSYGLAGFLVFIIVSLDVFCLKEKRNILVKEEKP